MLLLLQLVLDVVFDEPNLLSLKFQILTLALVYSMYPAKATKNV